MYCHGGKAYTYRIGQQLHMVQSYRCSGGCETPRAYPKYRLCLIGTDGTGTAEFVLFNRVAQQLVGESVVPLLKSSGIPPEIAAIVLQKYTLAVSVTEKSLTQRNISFQVNGIETFFDKQTCVPNDTRVSATTPLRSLGSLAVVELPDSSGSKAADVTELQIVPAETPKRAAISRVPLGSVKRKLFESNASEMEGKEHESSATVLEASLETITQNVKNVPAGSAELSSKAATSVDSTEFQAKTPGIPSGYSLIPTISSDGGAPSLPYVPSAKKSNVGKKTKTKL